MAELFRLKVSPEQRIDLPAMLSGRLGLKPGDELEFLIGDDNSLSVTKILEASNSEPAKEKLEELERRAKRPAAPKELLDEALQRRGRALTTKNGRSAS